VRLQQAVDASILARVIGPWDDADQIHPLPDTDEINDQQKADQRAGQRHW
jgi:hypothetical protein